MVRGRRIGREPRSLAIADGSLTVWEKQAKRNQAPDALDAGEPAELERLRRETRDLKMDRELVRKAAAYFAQGTNR